MSIYTVQAPIGLLGEPDLERAVFLREGFSWGAFFLSLLWLLWQRLWLTAALWIALCVALSVVSASHLTFGGSFFIALALHILLGLEANALLRRRLGRRHYRLLGVVSATNLENAERLFFARLTQSPSQPQTVPPPPPPPAQQTPPVLGMFPEPEMRR